MEKKKVEREEDDVEEGNTNVTYYRKETNNTTHCKKKNKMNKVWRIITGVTVFYCFKYYFLVVFSFSLLLSLYSTLTQDKKNKQTNRHTQHVFCTA